MACKLNQVQAACDRCGRAFSYLHHEGVACYECRRSRSGRVWLLPVAEVFTNDSPSERERRQSLVSCRRAEPPQETP